MSITPAELEFARNPEGRKMKQRTYNSFRDVKRALFGGPVKSRRADGGRVHVVVTDNPDALNGATGECKQTRVQKTDGKNIASPS